LKPIGCSKIGLAQRLQRVTVVIEQPVAVFLDEARPTVLLRHRTLLVIRRLGSLVGHLEEQQIGKLSLSACPGLDPG
jgi:hypothetical protein